MLVVDGSGVVFAVSVASTALDPVLVTPVLVIELEFVGTSANIPPVVWLLA
jgi:hypothetical protein